MSYMTTAAFGTGDPTPTGWEPPGFKMDSYRGGDLYRVKLDIQGKAEFLTDFSIPS